MKNLYFVGCLAAAALLSVGLGACSSDEVVEDIASVEQQPDDAAALIDFGSFPAFSGGTRADAVGGKTGYEAGDEMEISLFASTESTNASASCIYQYTSNGTWEPKDDSQTALTRQNLNNAALWKAEFTQNHADGAEKGTYEVMNCKSESYMSGNPIVISLKRDYSRLRIHTGIAGLEGVEVSLGDYSNPSSSERGTGNFTLTSDANGDVIIYGTFGGGSSVKASLAGDAPDLTGCSEYISYEGNVEKNFPSNTASNHSYLVNVNLGMTLDLDAAAAKQVNEVTSKVNSLSSTYKYWKVISSGENTLENWAPNYFTRTAVEVLDMSEALSITSLANNFFSVLSNIRKVTLPSNLTAVSDNAFQGRTSLTSVVLGEKVTTIGNYAFAGCSSLSAITLGDNVTILGDYAFASCTSLESITLSDNITAIGECTFAGCSSLSSVTFGENVTTIGKQAFSNCTSLGSITLGKNITTIEANAFAGCTSLGSITLGENITTIGANAFAGCSNLSSVTLGPNIQSIAASAFQDKSIKTVTLDRIPASVLAETLNKQLFTPYVSTIIGYISDADGEDAMSTYATGINNVFYIISQVGYPTVYVDKYVDALQTNLGSAFTVRSIDEYTE